MLLLALVVALANAQNTGYDEALARRMLNLAAAAYGNMTSYDGCIAQTFPPAEQHSVIATADIDCDIFNSLCEVYIVASNVTRQGIVIFRGTKTASQLLLEGWTTLEKGFDFYEMGTVNRYFKNAHEKLWSTVEQFLTNPLYQDFNIIVTGHSLGGALASLTAARTVKQNLRPAALVQLYTFGQPRTGGYEYAKNFDALGIKSYRVVFSSDIVPHNPGCEKDKTIPPLPNGSEACLASNDDNAYHHGTEIWYPNEMTPGAQFIQCVGTPKNEDMNCSDSLVLKRNQFELYAWDHRHYFNVFVTGYGKSGCTNTTLDPPPTGSESIISDIKSILRGRR